MAANSEHDSDPTLTSLLAGVVADIQDLLVQELALARHEIRQEIRKTTSALTVLSLGIGFGAIGGALLLLMLVHLLETTTALPHWAAYGIVGGGCAILGALLFVAGRQRAATIDVIPEATIETVKETAEWIKGNRRSSRIWNRPAPPLPRSSS